jgi:hypothetical protein
LNEDVIVPHFRERDGHDGEIFGLLISIFRVEIDVSQGDVGVQAVELMTSERMTLMVSAVGI